MVWLQWVKEDNPVFLIPMELGKNWRNPPTITVGGIAMDKEGGKNMSSIIDLLHRKIPDYYPTMYQDGYSMIEITQAIHQKMIRDYYDRKAETEIPEINVISEVKIKWPRRNGKNAGKSSPPFWRRRFCGLWSRIWKRLWIWHWTKYSKAGNKETASRPFCGNACRFLLYRGQLGKSLPDCCCHLAGGQATLYCFWRLRVKISRIYPRPIKQLVSWTVWEGLKRPECCHQTGKICPRYCCPLFLNREVFDNVPWLTFQQTADGFQCRPRYHLSITDFLKHSLPHYFVFADCAGVVARFFQLGNYIHLVFHRHKYTSSIVVYYTTKYTYFKCQ